MCIDIDCVTTPPLTYFFSFFNQSTYNFQEKSTFEHKRKNLLIEW